MLLLLLACVGNVSVEPSQNGCTNVDFDDPEDSSLQSSVDGTTAEIWRTFVTRPNSDDLFEPEVSGSGTVLEVREAWTEGDDASEACLEPHITVTDLAGELEVRWYTDDSNIPFNTVKVSPE